MRSPSAPPRSTCRSRRARVRCGRSSRPSSMPAGDPIELLLQGRYPDPETGDRRSPRPRARSRSSRRSTAPRPSWSGGSTSAAASSSSPTSTRTRRSAIASTARSAASRSCCPTASSPTSRRSRRSRPRSMPGVDAVVAVGSGTINDICKMVALGRDCPQVVFATAPSMNGYTSLSASLTEHGFKRSVRALTPTAAFFDLGVLAAAPSRLIRSGLGDSLAPPDRAGRLAARAPPARPAVPRGAVRTARRRRGRAARGAGGARRAATSARCATSSARSCSRASA